MKSLVVSMKDCVVCLSQTKSMACISLEQLFLWKDIKQWPMAFCEIFQQFTEPDKMGVISYGTKNSGKMEMHYQSPKIYTSTW